VLLVCFNRHLGTALAAGVTDDEARPAGRVEALHFHRLCRRAYEALALPFPVPDSPEDRSAFWVEEAPLVLFEAIEEGLVGPWDAIVVDEGQDFADLWWETLESGLRDPQKGRMVFFYDPAQELFGRQPTPPPWPTLRLTRNFRNTRAIALELARLVPDSAPPHERCPEGVAPSVHPLDSPARQREGIDRVVAELLREGLTPEQIVVLTPHSRPHSCLKDVTALGGAPLAEAPDQRTGAVLHATIGAFKGLESAAVILADVDPADPRCGVRARYVAASRARHVLHVFAKGDWLAGAPG